MKATLERVRRPEYTGERRCWPCTGLNAAILTVGVALVWLTSAPVAAAVAILGTAAIWLRGYLVPYTPHFAPRLVALLPGFDAHAGERATETTTLAVDGELDGEAVAEALLDSGVVVEDAPDGETLQLDDEFRKRWRAEMRTLRDLDYEELAAAVLASAPGAVEAEPRTRSDRTWIVLSDGTGRLAGEMWLSHPVAVAEAAAVRALAETVPDGDDVLFAAAARPLRTFLQHCPICEGEVIETTTRACCGGAPNPMANPTRSVLACADCDRRVYTFERETYVTEV